MFTNRSKWIWNASDRWAQHEYIEARRVFVLRPVELRRLVQGEATLTITAEAAYQAWFNGHVIGHGPAKSAKGRRSVDTYDLAGLLREGANELRLLVLSQGIGTMRYCPAPAGVRFEVVLGTRRIGSDARTEVRIASERRQRTARRWMMACMEDVDAAVRNGPWRPAKVVDNATRLYRRRVPLSTRRELRPVRLVSAEFVDLPNVSISFRLRPYLADKPDRLRNNDYSTPAYVVTEVISPCAQSLTFAPSFGSLAWYFQGQKLFEGGMSWLWDPQTARPRIRLKKGPNRLIGVHRASHLEEASLVGFARRAVEFDNPFGAGAYQVVPLGRGEELQEGPELRQIDWDALRPAMPAMDPLHAIPFGNAQDLAMNARPRTQPSALLRTLEATPASEPLVLPPAPPDRAVRAILDLGVLHNGWLAFDAEGLAGSRLIVSMFEGLLEGPPMRIQWPQACNNALTYRLRDGRQSFESFFPYGVRYLAVYHTGRRPLRVSNLRIHTANCGSICQGALHTGDALLDGIYRICVQSVISGVDDTFTDCPTFEQVNWNFDNRMAALGDMLTCANYDVIRNSIELFAEDPEFCGLVRSQYPSTWDNSIPLWAFHWVLWIRDYYEYTGDAKFVRQLIPRITRGIKEALGRLGPRGLMKWSGGTEVWHFIEWGTGRDDDHAIMSAEQAGLVAALEAACDLAKVAGGQYARNVPAWRRARRNLIRAIDEHLWDPRRRAYVDSLHEDGTPSPVASQTTNAAMCVFGVIGPEYQNRLARRIVQGDKTLLPYGSPYGLYYILELLDARGDVDGIFRLLRHRWGDMIRAGDTTTWEHFADYFSRKGNAGFPTRSRCHPFAAYVLKYFVKYILGLERCAPGYTRFRVRPRPPRGLDRAEGAVPTPRGRIRIAWSRRRGRLDLRVEHPDSLKRIGMDQQ